MRAIVIATGYNPSMSPLTDWYPVPMLPVVDRPIIQHVVEYLVDQGVTACDFVLSHLPEKIEGMLGDGTRWGSVFRYHLVRDQAQSYQALSTIAPPGTSVLLAHADRLPDVRLDARSDGPILYAAASPPPGPPAWSGWAQVPSDLLAGLPEGADEAALAAHLFSCVDATRIVPVSRMLSVRSFEQLIEANRMVLSGDFPVRLLTGTQTEEHLWISRNVSLHPTARLNPPVFIGENCRIGAGVQIGPNAAIGRDCILDSHCTVQDSLVFRGSYIGESLELADVVVDRSRLINVRVGAAMSIRDDFILGSLSEGHMRQWTGRTLSRIMGIVLLLPALPLLAATALALRLTRRGRVVHKIACVLLPASSQEWEWRTFSLWRFSDEPPAEYLAKRRYFRALRHGLMYLLPGLINVARGELRFVGVPPRTRAMIASLSPDWQALYLGSKAGVITEADMQYFGTLPTEDEQYTAEAFYAVTARPGYDLKLLCRYLGRVVNPWG
jgi:lipopolysaccharide/colanic/teichoic acid biosynthesis glycosyltransferase